MRVLLILAGLVAAVYLVEEMGGPGGFSFSKGSGFASSGSGTKGGFSGYTGASGSAASGAAGAAKNIMK